MAAEVLARPRATPRQPADGSAVRLTVQKYYTPAVCIQKPYDEGVDAYRMESLTGTKPAK